MKVSYPVLYSFRRCPYAIRARLAIKVSGIQVELREIALADKPQQMLLSSSKGTVPVLVLADGTVIDESRDIMLWALLQNNPENWLVDDSELMAEISHIIDINDNEFKPHLDHYKYADRFPEHPMEHYRQQAEGFLQQLEQKLNQTEYLVSDNISLADMAVLPFVRQFAHVDKEWFYQTHYKKCQTWLDDLLESALFSDVMKKYPRWQAGDSMQRF